MEETLRQLHLERIARRQPVVLIPQVEESKVEDKMEETKEDPVVEEEEEEACSVCLSPMETKHTLQCGHVICGECPAMMMTQNLGNGCVGQHAEAGIKVIKCPICRKEDMPTREELIAEIVRIRRGGHFSRLAPAPVPRVVVHHPIVHHNLPAIIPVLHPVILNPPPAPAPAHNPVAMQDGNWLRNQHFRPRRNEDLHLHRNYLPLHYPGYIADVARWNILRGHAPDDAIAVGQFLNGGQRVGGQGWICGVAGTRRFYHQQYLIPDDTEGLVPARRLCNNVVCQGNHRSRTARRCPRNCGQFICQACNRCNTQECQPIN